MNPMTWNQKVQYPINKDFPKIHNHSLINLIPHIDTYFFKINSNIILSSHLRLSLAKNLFPVGLSVKILKSFLSSILATCLSILIA